MIYINFSDSFKYIRWFSQNVSIIDVKQGFKYVSAFELARRSNWIFSCIAFTLCWFSASDIREKIQNRELHRIDQHSYQLLSYHRLISVNVSLLSILLLKIMFDVFLLFWKKNILLQKLFLFLRYSNFRNGSLISWRMKQEIDFTLLSNFGSKHSLVMKCGVFM